jgi:hypothetical protein
MYLLKVRSTCLKGDIVAVGAIETYGIAGASIAVGHNCTAEVATATN